MSDHKGQELRIEAARPKWQITAMRTTLDIEESAFEAARAKSEKEKISLGEAVSHLILQGVQAPYPKLDDDIARVVFRSSGGPYTSADVEAALNDE